MNKHFKILRAHEELGRCNVEIARLRAWLYHEDEEYLKSMEKASKRDLRDTLIGLEVADDYFTRDRTNEQHHRILNRIEGLEGFTGIKGAGRPRDMIVPDEAEVEKDLEVDEDGLGGGVDVGEWEDCVGITDVLENLCID